MPVWTRDKGEPYRRRCETPAKSAGPGPRVQARAMATASRVFASVSEATPLTTLAASVLAVEPGQMCLVSLAPRGGDSLHPVAVAHQQPTESRRLQGYLAPERRTPADAFSRAVFRSGGSLRMAIGSPGTLRLWLPEAYWAYAERTGISAVLAAALRDRTRIFGTLLVWRERDQPAFNEWDQAYVTSLAARLSLGLLVQPLVASSSAPAAIR